MQRARKVEDKELRRRAILEAARAVWRERPFAAAALAEVAERAGVVKGTVYLYFPTREALALALLEELLESWFDEVDAALARARRATPARVAGWMGAALARRDPLGRLLCVLQTILEHNLDAATVRRFKGWLLQRMVATGARLERALPALPAGAGARLLLSVNALVVGLWQMGDPAPVVRAVLAEPALQPLRVEFSVEFPAACAALIAGVMRRRKR